MCYVHLEKNTAHHCKRLLTVEEWKAIIRQAVDAGMIYVTLTGGECLTYPGFKDVYMYVRSLGIQPDLMTNGLLFTEEMVEFLKENPPGVIQMSLYGSCEDAYERVTGHRVFQQVINAIERIKNAGLNLVLSVTPNRYMQDDAEKLLNLLYSLHVPYVIGSSTLPARPETERDIKEFKVELDTLFLIQKLNNEHCRTLPNEAPSHFMTRYIPSETKRLEGLQCGGAHCSFHVNWKGEICPCIAFAPSVHCNILDKSFLDGWDSIRETMKAFRPPDECAECDMRDCCASCPGEKCMSVLNGALNTSICERLKRNIEEGYIHTRRDCF